MAKQITPKEASNLCNNFDTKYAELCKYIKKDDNRSVLFSLQELKNYIEYLENSKNDIDGIRIYLGSYDNNQTKAENNDLTTVFLTPTSGGVDDTKLNAFNYGTSGRPPKKKYSK